MTGDEHQRQHVVVDPVGIARELARGGIRGDGWRPRHGAALAHVVSEDGVAPVEGGAAPERVDRPPPSDGHQPPRRVLGHAVAGPGDERLRQGLLGEVLGEREVAGVAGERADDSGRLDPPHRTDGITRCAHRSLTTVRWPPATPAPS